MLYVLFHIHFFLIFSNEWIRMCAWTALDDASSYFLWVLPEIYYDYFCTFQSCWQEFLVYLVWRFFFFIVYAPFGACIFGDLYSHQKRFAIFTTAAVYLRGDILWLTFRHNIVHPWLIIVVYGSYYLVLFIYIGDTVSVSQGHQPLVSLLILQYRWKWYVGMSRCQEAPS